MPHDVIANRPQQCTPERPQASRADRNEVEIAALGLLQELLGRATGRNASLDLEPPVAQLGRPSLRLPLGSIAHLLLYLLVLLHRFRRDVNRPARIRKEQR